MSKNKAAIDVARTLYGTAYDCKEVLDLFSENWQPHKYGEKASELNYLINKLRETTSYMYGAADRAESDLINATQHSEECVKICDEIAEALKKVGMVCQRGKKFKPDGWVPPSVQESKRRFRNLTADIIEEMRLSFKETSHSIFTSDQAQELEKENK